MVEIELDGTLDEGISGCLLPRTDQSLPPVSVDRRERPVGTGVFDLLGLDGFGVELREENPKEPFDNLRKEEGSMRRKRWDLGKVPPGVGLLLRSLLRALGGVVSCDGGIQGARR